MNIFQLIRMLVNRQITNENGNAKFNKDGLEWNEVTVTSSPYKAIEWLKGQGAGEFEVKKMYDFYSVKPKYKVIMKSYNLESPFFERERRRVTPTSELQKLYDYESHHRAEKGYYSQARCDDEYYIFDQDRYEKLSLEDNTTFELFLQSIGYNSYRDFLKQHEKELMKNEDLSEIIQEEYNNFLETLVQEYEI